MQVTDPPDRQAAAEAGAVREHVPIPCRCGMLIAKRHRGGGVQLVVSGMVRIDPDGRFVIECPSCGHRVRFRVQRAAA